MENKEVGVVVKGEAQIQTPKLGMQEIRSSKLGNQQLMKPEAGFLLLPK